MYCLPDSSIVLVCNPETSSRVTLASLGTVFQTDSKTTKQHNNQTTRQQNNKTTRQQNNNIHPIPHISCFP